MTPYWYGTGIFCPRYSRDHIIIEEIVRVLSVSVSVMEEVILTHAKSAWCLQ